MNGDAEVTLPVVQSCDGCGACCLEQESPPGYLWILIHGFDIDGNPNSEDVKRFNAMPPESLAEFHAYAQRMRDQGEHPNDSICIWFDEQKRQCKHYDLRPSICREELQVNDEACHRWREAYQIDGVSQ